MLDIVKASYVPREPYFWLVTRVARNRARMVVFFFQGSTECAQLLGFFLGSCTSCILQNKILFLKRRLIISNWKINSHISSSSGYEHSLETVTTRPYYLTNSVFLSVNSIGLLKLIGITTSLESCDN